MKNITLRYGLIAGAIVSVLMLISQPFMKEATPEDIKNFEILGYVTMLLSLSTVFIAIKTFRDKYNDGVIKFGKAFLIGLYISLIAGAIYALTFVLYFNLIDNSFVEVYKNMQIEQLDAQGLSATEKDLKIAEIDEQMEMYTHPVVMFLVSMLMEYLPVGLVVSLIAAAILKKK